MKIIQIIVLNKNNRKITSFQKMLTYFIFLFKEKLLNYTIFLKNKINVKS